MCFQPRHRSHLPPAFPTMTSGSEINTPHLVTGSLSFLLRFPQGLPRVSPGKQPPRSHHHEKDYRAFAPNRAPALQ